MMTFQYGDVVFFKSYGIISRIIRLIISVRYGVPFKYAWSHVAMAVSKENFISAEPSGVEYVPIKKNPDLIKCDAVGYRFTKEITIDCKAKMTIRQNEILGKGYGYFRYALDFLRVLMFYFILLGVIPAAIFYKTIGIYFLIAVAVMIIAEKILGIFDRKTYDCVEAISSILNAGDFWSPVAFKPRSEFPDGMLQVFETLTLHGAAIKICNKRIGEDFK